LGHLALFCNLLWIDVVRVDIAQTLAITVATVRQFTSVEAWIDH
jgi:hypothetical protein